MKVDPLNCVDWFALANCVPDTGRMEVFIDDADLNEA